MKRFTARALPLVESTVAIVILAILSAFALPDPAGWPTGGHLRTASTDLQVGLTCTPAAGIATTAMGC